MRIISYNLHQHRAVQELPALVRDHDADVLCLQEAETARLPEHIGPLTLVHATERNRLGLALYVRDTRFELGAVHAVQLKRSLHDRVLQPAHERLLGARLHDRVTGAELVVASFHAAPLTARNALRRHQIDAGMAALGALGPALPAVMVGDFNYPVFQRRLDRHMRAAGYELNRSDRHTYRRYFMFRGHYDFAAASELRIAQVRTLARGGSDHLPILVTAEL